jgi:putative phosphoesterase
MKIGVFSDAHGNETGFKTCYEYLSRGVDLVYYLGDAVGYFPLSNQIIDTLRLSNIQCLKGNHDAMILGELEYAKEREEIYQVKKSAEIISEQNLKFLKELPAERKINIDTRDLLFVHGSPLDPLNGYVYPDSDISQFEDMPYDAIFMGHTHRPFIKRIGMKNIVNVGSCGLPRDVGNRLTIAVYDTITNETTIKEFPFDVNEVINNYGAYIHASVKDVLKRNNKNFPNE